MELGIERVNIGTAWLRFRHFTNEDRRAIAFDPDRDRWIEQIDHRLSSPGAAAQAFLLQKFAERCFVDWSPGFLNNEDIRALIGQHDEQSSVGAVLRDLLIHRAIAQAFLTAVTPPEGDAVKLQ